MPSEANEPGDPVVTRMPSAASHRDRFFDGLVRAALGGVWVTMSADWRLVAWKRPWPPLATGPAGLPADGTHRGPGALRPVERARRRPSPGGRPWPKVR